MAPTPDPRAGAATRVEPALHPGATWRVDGPQPAAPAPRTGSAIVALGLLVFIGLVAGTYWSWWPWSPASSAAPPTAAAPAAAPVEPADPASTAALPRHPIDAVAAGTEGAAGAAPSLRKDLIGLLGERAVLTLLQTDDFAARVAATVDNLGRSHAAPRPSTAPGMPSSRRPTGGWGTRRAISTTDSSR